MEIRIIELRRCKNLMISHRFFLVGDTMQPTREECCRDRNIYNESLSPEGLFSCVNPDLVPLSDFPDLPDLKAYLSQMHCLFSGFDPKEFAAGSPMFTAQLISAANAKDVPLHVPAVPGSGYLFLSASAKRSSSLMTKGLLTLQV
jgi:hypothetical protein